MDLQIGLRWFAWIFFDLVPHEMPSKLAETVIWRPGSYDRRPAASVALLILILLILLLLLMLIVVITSNQSMIRNCWGNMSWITRPKESRRSFLYMLDAHLMRIDEVAVSRLCCDSVCTMCIHSASTCTSMSYRPTCGRNIYTVLATTSSPTPSPPDSLGMVVLGLYYKHFDTYIMSNYFLIV